MPSSMPDAIVDNDTGPQQDMVLEVRSDEHPTPTQIHSQVSTPKMSQRQVRSLFLQTPPHTPPNLGHGISETDGNEHGNITPPAVDASVFSSNSPPPLSTFMTPFLENDEVDINKASSHRRISSLPIPQSYYDRHHDTYHDPLEPPAWKPPNQEEVEYVDSWNNVYSNPHHYLQVGMSGMNACKDDASSIGSSQTNNTYNTNGSFTNPHHPSHHANHHHHSHKYPLPHASANTGNTLRPRGLSLSSYGSYTPSVTSCPAHQGGPPRNHRRMVSLPPSLFSSQPASVGKHHLQNPLPSQPQSKIPRHIRHNSGTNYTIHSHPKPIETSSKQHHNHLLNSLSSKHTTPYEIHSHCNPSQVQADAAMAGLEGALLDLYAVDRCVDGAVARMLATKDEVVNPLQDGQYGQNGQFGHHSQSATLGPHSQQHQNGQRPQATTQKQRKTSIGTLQDIQTILELHRVDKMVDRFKQGLQMPVFLEEEAWEDGILRELRGVDLEMEHFGGLGSKDKEHTGLTERVEKERICGQFQWSSSDEEEDGDWGQDDMLASSDRDPFLFYDPFETAALQAISYQQSLISSSTTDNLHEVIDLLRTDVEIDGASRRNADLEMLRPLLETDRLMEKLKDRTEWKDTLGEITSLYLVDLEIDSATKRAVGGRKNEKDVSVHRTQTQDTHKPTELSSNTLIDTAASVIEEDESIEHTLVESHEMKNILSQHISAATQPFCPTSPVIMATKNVTSHGVLHSNHTLLPLLESSPLPPASLAPNASTYEQSKRSIFSPTLKSSDGGNPSNAATTNTAHASTKKRSIFSKKEKSSAANSCAFQRGVMMPGTTISVLVEGGEMIDDIPVGKVVAPSAISGNAASANSVSIRQSGQYY